MMSDLDTRGAVYGDVPNYQATLWRDLSPFTQGYIEELLRTAPEDVNFRAKWLTRDIVNDVPEEQWREGWPDFSDIAPETLARIIADCEDATAERNGWNYLPTVEGGCEFWERRQKQGHHGHPPLTVRLSDDGKVRFS